MCNKAHLLRVVRWIRWHCPPHTGFEIRALAVWGQAGYYMYFVTEAPRDAESSRANGEVFSLWNLHARAGDFPGRSWVYRSCCIALWKYNITLLMANNDILTNRKRSTLSYIIFWWLICVNLGNRSMSNIFIIWAPTSILFISPTY